jgi:hypothetical protein
MTARLEGDFVLFLIGMRINRVWKPHRWLPVVQAMTRMLSELHAQPESGFLSHHVWFGRTTIVVQYWRSLDQLLAYAHKPEAEHLPAWKAFNRAIGTNGDVGIWHETYCIAAGSCESIYVNMPPFGLGGVGKLEPAQGRRETAAGRLQP